MVRVVQPMKLGITQSVAPGESNRHGLSPDRIEIRIPTGYSHTVERQARQERYEEPS